MQQPIMTTQLSMVLCNDKIFRQTFMQGPDNCKAWLAMCIARAMDVYDPPLDTETYLRQMYSPSILANLERRVQAALSITTQDCNGELLLAVPCAATSVSGPILGPVFTPYTLLHESVLVKPAAPPPEWSDECLDEWLNIC